MDKPSEKSYMAGFVPYALGAFLVGTVGGFVAVLGPAFVSDLGLPYNNTTWTALATAMSAAACAPVLGKLGDVLGRKNTLLLGIAISFLGNVLTAVAPSLPFMLVARFIYGIGTAAIGPVVMAYIVTEFPTDQIARGFSLYMLISSLSVVFGPTLGGIIISRWGWRAMMWLCAGICAVILVICLLIRDNATSTRKSMAGFDYSGALFVLVFFSLLLCVPSFGQNFGWGSAAFWVVLAASVGSLIGLVVAEKRAKYPILPIHFIRRKPFVLCVVALFLTQGLMQANTTNTIVFINYTQPENSVISGYAISIMYLGMSLGAVVLGPLADRWEPKWVLTGSLAVTGIGCALMLLYSPSTSVLLLALSLGLLGFGLGGNGTAFMKVALSGIPPQEAGGGTGTYGLFRDIAPPFGVAMFVPMFTNRITRLMAAGTGEADAAVNAIRNLAGVELLCIVLGIAVVLMLPRGKGKKA